MTVRIFLRSLRHRAWLTVACTALLSLATVPSVAPAQSVAGGDFDICDYCGNLVGNVLRLRGRADFGTNPGTFVLFNASSVEQDVDGDGFTAGIDFTNLFISSVGDFQNVADPSRIIESANFVLGDALNPLRNGFQNVVRVSVRIPGGTPAGIYSASVQIRDSVRAPGVNPNGEQLRIDHFVIEIEVLPTDALALVDRLGPIGIVLTPGFQQQHAATALGQALRQKDSGNAATGDADAVALGLRRLQELGDV